MSYIDPTVRVAALSVFEAIASCDPVTPEIFEILVKQSDVNIASDQPVNISVSDNTEEDEEGEEEIDIEDLKNNLINEYNNELFKETNICFLIHVCLENISNKVYLHFKLKFYMNDIKHRIFLKINNHVSNYLDNEYTCSSSITKINW